MNEPRLVTFLDDAEPLTLAQARLQCRIDAEGSPPSHPDDDLLTAFVAVAREQVERFTGRALRYQRLRVALDAFADVIDLPYSPVLAIESVSYVDGAGATVVLDAADYRLDVRTVPARLAPAVGTTWPTPAEVPGAVEIVYTAGYPTGGSPDPEPVPRSLVHAMRLMLTHWYEHRSDVEATQHYEIPMGSVALMTPFRVRLGIA